MKKSIPLLLTVALVISGIAVLIPGQGVCATVSLEVRAWIDGRSHLYIQGDSMAWAHYDWTRPGLEPMGEGYPEPPYPTYVSTYLNGALVENFQWVASWPDDGNVSGIWNGLNPAIPTTSLLSSTLTFTETRESGSLWVVQYAHADNSYVTILEFNDNGPPDAAWYTARMDYTTVPIPSVAWLLGSGLFGMGLFRRFHPRRKP